MEGSLLVLGRQRMKNEGMFILLTISVQGGVFRTLETAFRGFKCCTNFEVIELLKHNILFYVILNFCRSFWLSRCLTMLNAPLLFGVRFQY